MQPVYSAVVMVEIVILNDWSVCIVKRKGGEGRGGEKKKED